MYGSRRTFETGYILRSLHHCRASAAPASTTLKRSQLKVMPTTCKQRSCGTRARAGPVRERGGVRRVPITRSDDDESLVSRGSAPAEELQSPKIF